MANFSVPSPMLITNGKKNLNIEFTRTGIFCFALGIAISSYLFQPYYIHLEVLYKSYSILCFGFIAHLLLISQINFFYQSKHALYLTFLLDVILISGLIWTNPQNQSVYMFLHLVNILLAGFVFHTRGAILIALVAGLTFSFASLLGPEARPLNLLSLMALNNISFLFTAGVSGFIADQLFDTEQKLLESDLNLQSLEGLNKAIVENAPVGIISFDGNGRVLTANEQACEILGAELTTSSLFKNWPQIKTWILENRREVEHTRFSSKGELQYLAFHMNRFYHPQLREYVHLFIVQNRTEIVKLEEKLRQKEKLAAVGQLAAGIAHEIRNPLASISGSIEMLDQSSQKPEDKKLMSIVLREISRLNNLITEFLDYSRPNHKPNTSIDLSQVVQECLQGLRLQHELVKEVHIHTDFIEKAIIRGDADKLKQALLNLLINGIHALKDSSQKEIQISLKEKSNNYYLQIKDSGCGMNPEVQKKMFEPFFTTKAKGTGLGLALTHKIIESHGAEIEVRSQLGQGTEIDLVFEKLTI